MLTRKSTHCRMVILAITFFVSQAIAEELHNNSNLTVNREDGRDKYGIENINITAITEVHQYYCPSKPLCYTNASQPAEGNCCKGCVCSNCEKFGMNCCIDKLITNNTLLTHYDRFSCVRSQILPYESGVLINNNYNVYMIVTCSKDKSEYEHKCRKGQDYPDEYDITLYIPVSSNVSFRTFRNKYCALCNGENIVNLHAWDMKYVCKDAQPVVFKSTQHMMKYLLQQKHCNVLFRTDRFFPMSCDWGIYSKCNMTGTWEHYDRDVDWACSHFSNIYRNIYRNEFCYICNTQSSLHENTSCNGGISRGRLDSIGSFGALLNFADTKLKSEQVEVKCPISHVYDDLKKQCREVHCRPPMQYHQGECTDVVYKIQKARFDLFLRFDKSKTSKNSDCYSTGGASIYLLVTHFMMGFHSDGIVLCHTTVLRKEISNQLDFYVVHVEFFKSVFRNQNLKDLVKKILNSLGSFNEHYGKLGKCVNLNPRILSQTFYAKTKANIESNPLLRNYIDPWDGSTIYFDMYMNEVEGHQIYDSNRCSKDMWSLQVAGINACPLVDIDLNEFNITFEGEEMCIHDISMCLHSEDYILNQNCSVVKICSETYLSRIANIASSKEINTNEFFAEKLVSMLCSTLSIVSLIIVVLTYSLFPSLRTLPGLNNMILSVLLIFAHGFYTFSANTTWHVMFCKSVGLLIHFLWLCAILMMNVCSFTMFKAFTRLEKPSILSRRQVLTSFSFGVGYCFVIAACFVVANVLYSFFTSQVHDIGYGGNVCFINNRYGLVFFFALPIGLIILANVSMFILVVVKICRLPSFRENSTNQRRNLEIYVKLSTITGITWIFGFIKELININLFEYFFVILNASQGVFIMFSFVGNKRVYNLYRSLIGRSTTQSEPTSSTLYTSASHNGCSQRGSASRVTGGEDTKM